MSVDEHNSGVRVQKRQLPNIILQLKHENVGCRTKHRFPSAKTSVAEHNIVAQVRKRRLPSITSESEYNNVGCRATYVVSDEKKTSGNPLLSFPGLLPLQRESYRCLSAYCVYYREVVTIKTYFNHPTDINTSKLLCVRKLPLKERKIVKGYFFVKNESKNGLP